MPPVLISEAGGSSPQLAFWRENFIARPQALRDEIEPGPSDPVFVALYPPADIGARIRSLAWDLRRRYCLREYPIDRDRLHMSLHGICRYGDLTPAALMAIGTACASVLHPAFRVGFDRVESFIGRTKRALVLRGDGGTDGIRMLHAELGVALRGVGVASAGRQIEPHLTLLYDPRGINEAIPEIGWMVSEFRLVCSLQGRHRHIPLARWRLPGASRC